MYICICNCVTENDVERARREGAVTADEVFEKTGAGNCCGACKPVIQDLLGTPMALSLPMKETGGLDPQSN